MEAAGVGSARAAGNRGRCRSPVRWPGRGRVLRGAVAVGLALVSGGGTTVRAQETPPVPRLTLGDCVRLGLARAIPVQNAQRDEAIAAARIGQVRAQILPDLKASGEYLRYGDLQSFDTGQGVVPLGRQDNYSASAEVRQLLYDGGSVRAAMKAARTYREKAEQETRQAEAARVRDIKLAFYRVLLAEQNVAVEEASAEQLRGLVAQAEARFRQEAASEFDLLSARVRLANQQPNLIAARRDVRVARAALRNLLMLEERDFELVGSLEFRPAGASLEAALEAGRRQRPEIQSQLSQVVLDEVDIRYERGGYLPEVSARAAYRGQNPESFISAEDDWSWRWDAGLVLEWSLFDGALRRHRVAEKTLELSKSRARLVELERSVELEIEQAWLDLVHAAEAVAASRENIGLAAKGLDIARTRHAAGLSTYLEFADANLALSTARLNHARALCAHLQAEAVLDYACGRTPSAPDEGNAP